MKVNYNVSISSDLLVGEKSTQCKMWLCCAFQKARKIVEAKVSNNGVDAAVKKQFTIFFRVKCNPALTSILGKKIVTTFA